MADFPMCRLSRCEYKTNCQRHWASGTKEEVYGQRTIAHHPQFAGHHPDKPCLAYAPAEAGFKPTKRKPQKRGKA